MSALSQDLRLRILDGEDVSAADMLIIVNEIRQERRAAARPEATKGRRAAPAGSRVPTDVEDLRALLDQELGP